MVARCPTALWKTRKPIATAVIDAISTAPAAMSFASFAFGSKDVVETSIRPSIAVFSISATRTKAIASTRAISWSRETPAAIAPPKTRTAARKWMRRFRCVRRTWMIPSNA